MGSFSEANGYNIDSAVGGLVWIRRRNGSWWPGRILSPNELPESCLLSPRRSGVPVQLLGKEDASVLSCSVVRLWGMGRGLGRGLGTNAQVTTPGGLGFRRGLLGGGFSPGVGRA
ncbi:putative PWWP domain containing protein PWWP2 [Helianthus annuus]|nr:putative PWWP domain containing protein PWWP2 [Helianthus annuus]KAJ0755875.1 putative PWWP domain containing protein PWWP2 [Helianthus annuus]KAJ0803765.1 putative PWWP domain containing protein PWWP2 [Helianthus annuus]